ncbi:MAG: hypothetical protein HC889_04075 [Synechococcaceae cyanobacterium SM1_2_3]|nr:hypothetical protein [Synechococcaceae cyanobacterium SM1_2_3]
MLITVVATVRHWRANRIAAFLEVDDGLRIAETAFYPSELSLHPFALKLCRRAFIGKNGVRQAHPERFLNPKRKSCPFPIWRSGIRKLANWAKPTRRVGSRSGRT